MCCLMSRISQRQLPEKLVPFDSFSPAQNVECVLRRRSPAFGSSVILNRESTDDWRSTYPSVQRVAAVNRHLGPVVMGAAAVPAARPTFIGSSFAPARTALLSAVGARLILPNLWLR